jgi:phosphoribosyl-AMP cyclohydrolase
LISQLAPYRTESATATESTDGDRGHGNVIASQQESARGILGLGHSRNHTVQRSLEAEVEVYLSDMQEGSSTISF